MTTTKSWTRSYDKGLEVNWVTVIDGDKKYAVQLPERKLWHDSANVTITRFEQNGAAWYYIAITKAANVGKTIPVNVEDYIPFGSKKAAETMIGKFGKTVGLHPVIVGIMRVLVPSDIAKEVKVESKSAMGEPVTCFIIGF